MISRVFRYMNQYKTNFTFTNNFQYFCETKVRYLHSLTVARAPRDHFQPKRESTTHKLSFWSTSSNDSNISIWLIYVLL
jgi:hypothetical protein